MCVVRVSAISSSTVNAAWLIQNAQKNNTAEEVAYEKSGSKKEETALNTITNNELNKQQQVKSSTRDVSSLTWSSLMKKLNLTPTGNYQEDYNKTVTRLNELIRYTRDPQKIKEYLDLADQVNVVFVSPQTSSIASNSMSGSEQISQLTRVMMLGAKV